RLNSLTREATRTSDFSSRSSALAKNTYLGVRRRSRSTGPPWLEPSYSSILAWFHAAMPQGCPERYCQIVQPPPPLETHQLLQTIHFQTPCVPARVSQAVLFSATISLPSIALGILRWLNEWCVSSFPNEFAVRERPRLGLARRRIAPVGVLRAAPRPGTTAARARAQLRLCRAPRQACFQL